MTHDPYAAPTTNLSDPVPADAARVRRPALVWFTQALLLFFCLAAAAGLLVGLIGLISRGNTVSTGRVAFGFVFTGAVGVLLGWLFYGFAYRRRWAWHGGVVFSLLFGVFVIWSRAHPVAGPIPLMEIKPNQMLGAAVAELVTTALLVLYPFRMFFSRKVRAFLSIKPFRRQAQPSGPSPK
jgi:hypothetical protein